MSKPLILVTNDDGFRSTGIQSLASALSTIGDVAMVAPEDERSGVGHAITLNRALRARPRGDNTWSVDGTPTDCVYLALYQLLSRPPDLVCSGINHGPNLGDDALYSGTVGGAMEAALTGIPAMAVSLCIGAPKNFAAAADFARRCAQFMLTRRWSPRTLLNINVPDTESPKVSEYTWTHGAHRCYGHEVIERRDLRGKPYYWIGGKVPGFKPSEGGDALAISQGIASITPLNMDITHRTLLSDLADAQLDGVELT